MRPNSAARSWGPELARQLRELHNTRSLAVGAQGTLQETTTAARFETEKEVDLRLAPWLRQLSPRQRRKLALDAIWLLLTVAGVFQAMRFGPTARLIALTAFVLQICRLSILVDELLNPDD